MFNLRQRKLSLHFVFGIRTGAIIEILSATLAGLCLLIIFPYAKASITANAIIDDEYDLNLDVSGEVNMDLAPTKEGALAIVSDTVKGTTNSPSGYKLYFSSNNDTADIAGHYGTIRATSGTYESPSTLQLTDAQPAVWGYAVAGLNNFDANYSVASPSDDAKFAAMPVAGSEQLIHTHTSTATDDTTEIYYGVKANLGIPAGDYQTAVRYLTVTDISSEVSGEAQITIGDGAAELTEGYVATTAEITTSLKTDRDLSDSTIQITVGNQVCANPTIIAQSPSLKLSCTIPAGFTNGKYDVAVNVLKLGKSYAIENGVTINKRKFNVAFSVANSSTGYGTVSTNMVDDAVDGSAITIDDNTVTIGTTTITAIPSAKTVQYSYSFNSWTNNCGSTITGNCAIDANFTRTLNGVMLTFDANGGNFSGAATNTLLYSVPEVIHYTSDAKTTSTTNAKTASGTHKSGINDALQYVNYANYYQDLTLDTNAPGPYDLTIYYATENVSYDYICVFDGTSHTPGTTDDCSDTSAIAPITNSGSTSGNKIGGGGTGKTAYVHTATYQLNNKTARIYFSSDSSNNSYGYWAEFAGGGDVINQNFISGAYIDKPSDRDNYIFIGWSTKSNATVPDWTYDPNAKVMSDTTIYAVWLQGKTFEQAFADDGKSKQSGYFKMQDMTPAICNSVPVVPSAVSELAVSAKLIDIRDNKLYWVSKLADGRCWMTQNLDLELSTSKALTPNDSNVSSNWTPNTTTQNGQYGGGINNFGSAAIWENNYNTKDHSYRPASDPVAGTFGKYGNDDETYFSPAFMEQSRWLADWKNNASCVSAGYSEKLCEHWSVGTFYSWRTATAGTGNASISSSKDTSASICSKGWHLPKSSEFQTLLDNGLTGTNMKEAPYYLLFSGNYHGTYGAVHFTTLNGFYWSSTSYSNTVKAYYLDIYGEHAYTNDGFRYLGMSVRCIANS